MLDSPYFHYMNNPKTAEIYWTLVDPPIEGESSSKPKANFQKIAACQRQRSQKFLRRRRKFSKSSALKFSEIRFTEIKATLMGQQAW